MYMHYDKSTIRGKRTGKTRDDRYITDEDDYTDLLGMGYTSRARPTTQRDVYYIPDTSLKLVITEDKVELFTLQGKKYVPLETKTNKNGYVVYYAIDHGYLDMKYVHALVCKTVNKTKPKEGYHYVFKDGDKCNVHPSNLDYELCNSDVTKVTNVPIVEDDND